MRKRRYIFEGEESSGYLSNNISVVRTIEDFKEFFYVPWVVYKDDPFWVPPFWREYDNFFRLSNPFWRHAEVKLFIAKRNNIACGRIAVFIDHMFWKIIGEKIGFFGFFESIEDYETMNSLFEVVKQWMRSKGIKKIWGPINGRIDIGCGFLYKGFDEPPSILSSYSPRYYLDFVEKLGMKPLRDQLLYKVDLDKPLSVELELSARNCLNNGIHIRKFNRLRANRELKWWIPFMIDVFSNHWGYIPVSYDEVKTRFGIREIRWFIDPSLFIIAEVDKKPIAFLWATPDYNQIFRKMDGKINARNYIKFLFNKHNINIGKLHLIGIKEEYRNQGIASCLNYYVLKEMQKRGYKSAEIGWIDEKNNASLRILEKANAKPYKKYRVYELNYNLNF